MPSKKGEGWIESGGMAGKLTKILSLEYLSFQLHMLRKVGLRPPSPHYRRAWDYEDEWS